MGGYVISSDTAGGGSRTAMIVIRVPAAAFQKAMHKLHRLGGGNVRSESVTARRSARSSSTSPPASATSAPRRGCCSS